MQAIIPSLSICLLAVASWRDLATRTIPDWVSCSLAVIGALWRAVQGPEALVASLTVGGALFAVLLFAHSRNVLGGGDVKLITALVLGFSPFEAYRLPIATAILGGALGLVYLALRLLPPIKMARCSTVLGRVYLAERGRIRRGHSLPYGVAIAMGASFVMIGNLRF
jgi:prepilin peptidase CpaA